MRECPCGIAVADCNYHRPIVERDLEPANREARKDVHRRAFLTGIAVAVSGADVGPGSDYWGIADGIAESIVDMEDSAEVLRAHLGIAPIL